MSISSNSFSLKIRFLLLFFFCNMIHLVAQPAVEADYLADIRVELQKKWPENRTINFVFHGHSVPSGYFKTPNVHTLQTYPHLVLQAVKEMYPYAVVNVITTSIGGENAEQGERRFQSEVLTHRPDVVFIDYALNDRHIGLERARKAWESMIKAALALNIKLVLLTPTPDQSTDLLLSDYSPLAQHAQQIRELAAKYHVGLVDSYAAFREKRANGEDIAVYMSQVNHPNEKGHRVVQELIIRWMKDFTVPFTPSADLAADFLNPPDYSRPRAFWWWLEGYITKQGILDDLTAMKEAGILGVILFDAGNSSYYEGTYSYSHSVLHTQSGPGFMTPEWRDLFAYSCKVADSLGIEISLNITSGWNDGGPWVTPEFASKKLVWSETEVDGGQKLNQPLPLPAKLLSFEDKPYFKPVAVLAVKLTPDAAAVKALPWFDIKAVHTIGVPQTPNQLGFDWETFVRPLPENLTGCHARMEDVIDISEYVDSEGRLVWDAPDGHYAILRFGYTGTGIKVSTHSPGAGGLAIDYMSVAAMDLQFEHTALPLLQEIKKNGTKSLKYLHDDSWELGAANWTPTMEQAFAGDHGYELRKYLPVVAGKIIDSHDVSDRFLYDFRRTIANLINRNHYLRLREIAHQEGLGIHPESGGPHPAPIDALLNMGLGDIPMGEFWAIAETHRVEPHRRLYVKQGASAAHIYGKRFMQAEGATTIGPHWERDPWMLKPTMDRVFCEGLNRYVIHTFTHSPKEAGKPGNEYFAGTHINPNVTWWKQGKAFLDWAARNSFLLSQGLFVADVAFYYGDNVPNQVPFKHIDPRLGEGYDYDVVNTDVILNRMSIRNGKIYLPDGMSYRVLVLPNRQAMNIQVLEKIEQLVKDGATVMGPQPETTTGASNADNRLKILSDLLWGKIDDTNTTENMYGKGKVVWGKTICDVLKDNGACPDFEYRNDDRPSEQATSIDYIHRRISQSSENTDIYYVANRLERPDYFRASFRTGDGDRQPEIWYPETGKTVPVNVYVQSDGQTSLPLYLDPFGSVFVVFRHPAKTKPVTSVKLDGKEIFPSVSMTFDKAPFEYLPDGKLGLNQSGTFEFTQDGKVKKVIAKINSAQYLSGSWQVSFDPDWGGPEKTEFPKLISWTELSDPGIKYYSGTAVYRKTFIVDKPNANTRVYLNLGELHNIAEVRINGQSAGIWWKKPFAGDITDLVRKGENTLEVAVVNLWPNRLIGDQFLPEDRRFTKTNVMKFTKDSPLLPSGLIGPVWLSFGTIFRK
ncbi:MAG: hypothetical protein EZS26_002833 [Candidatus Ordinivivax streblomastigis]|uniref:Glycosyl hydrolases family 2 sugar binding domain-containing protein n=1 Tax=Candidatus Ordinivivax streblomastigis TaxID=2540710 RepID=A0A5M8NX72_9BACT|nr:MAG: hypothetical protein EZS26_002833 [Candidatus Ordinivivax streblomastigis]